ncbi:MAG: histidine phosphatase family protein [Bacteroidota bacterium]|nr:histidine phosphatase family protein [Bacteroidota bacterium]
MKTLYIVRHAKSSWKHESLSDFERPLNKRGHHDAPMMATVLRERGVSVDYIRSSPANRALTTARLLAEGIGHDLEGIETDEQMYGAGDGQLLQIVRSLPGNARDAMIVGHNPGMMMLAERLAGFEVDNLPTCGIVCVDLDVTAWTAVQDGGGALRYFEYPRKHY